jgi:hypothetical protein
VPPPAKLPEVESPPPEEVLDAVESKDDVIERAQAPEEIVGEQPSVDELLGPDR